MPDTDVDVSTTDDTQVESQIDSILDGNSADTNTDETASQEQKTEETEENKTPETTMEEEPIQKDSCPEKFLKEDGTPDYAKLSKSYTELESYSTKKIQEQAERIKQLEEQHKQEAQQAAEQRGFDSPENMQLAYNVANRVVEDYLYFADKSDDPDYVRGLLAEYQNNPSQNLLEQIEDNFDVSIIKQVTSDVTGYANQLSQELEQKQNEMREQQLHNEAVSYLNNAYSKYPQMFEIKEVVDFFGDALKTKGDNFDASGFFEHINNLERFFRAKWEKELSERLGNDSAKKALESLTPTGTNNGHGKIGVNSSNSDIESYMDKII